MSKRRSKSTGGGAKKKPRVDETASNQEPFAQDSNYYYEDGNAVLLIENVLFKVHGSLIKAQSKVFEEMLVASLKKKGKKVQGSTDKSPIVVEGVRAAEFRNLLKMIYLPRSDSFYTTLEAPIQCLVALEFYLDIARLANQFQMADSETWAVNKLKTLMDVSGKMIFDYVAKHRQPEQTFKFLTDAWSYAQLTPDRLLRYDLRNLLQYYYTVPAPVDAAHALVSFRSLQQDQQDRSMLGFWYMLLLNRGHQEWVTDSFTQQDRIALFTTQVYLSPIPSSLAEGLTLPLVTEPVILTGGYVQALESMVCSSCLRPIGVAWKKAFNTDYYRSVVSSEALRATNALATLPRIRFEFADFVRQKPTDCSPRILETLDREIELLYERLGGYYRDID
ncbi:The BTB (BR-C, ttk and bab)/POZ (Pox virus and Zinc finger) domain [Ceratobasidium sp. AG-Ba]|nr:The BTB (BR-C, ttk and bab)/POZ (Pox virus and Zinc finger) domain [Ceratobasidium sp. AG-Ba]